MSRSRLVDLPSELLIHLIDFLDWPSLTSLHLTNSRFRDLLDRKTLEKHHKIRVEALYREETALLAQIESEYWIAAEESFQGYHSSSYTSSSLDPDLRAYEERYRCIHNALPCYHCLRWLSCLTADDATFATKSAFTRGRSTRSFNLGGSSAIKRICIPCGMRTKLYPKGTRVKHSVICARCGTLSSPLVNWAWFWNDPKKTWQMSFYCRDCLDVPSVMAQTLEQYQHERRWQRYEEGMREGKRYRVEKGRELRRQRGIILEGDLNMTASESSLADELDAKARRRFCTLMQEMRLCCSCS